MIKPSTFGKIMMEHVRSMSIYKEYSICSNPKKQNYVEYLGLMYMRFEDD